jgi:O-antigen/teichoic acid export membrane protein
MNWTRSAFYLTVTQIGVSGLTAASFFFLAATLSPQQLGVLSLLITVPSLGQNLLSLSYNKAAIFYLGRKIFSIEELIANGLIICMLLGIVLLAGIIPAKEYVTSFFPNVSFGIIILAAVSIPLQIFLYYLTESCIAGDRLLIAIIIKIISPLLYVIGCILTGLTGRLTGEIAFIFYVAGISLANLTALTYLIVTSRDKMLFKPGMIAAISCLKYGGITQIGELAQYLAIRLDLILVGFWAGVEASGYYSIAGRLAEVFWLAAYSLQVVFSAKVARDFQATLSDKGQRLSQVVRYVMVGCLLGSLVVIFGSFIIFQFMLTQYQPAFKLLVALVPGQIALVVFLVLIGNLIGDELPMLATKLRVVFFVFSVVLYFALIPTFKETGAAIATSTSYIISTVIAAIILARTYQIRLQDFFLWKEEDRKILLSSRQYLRRYFAI